MLQVCTFAAKKKKQMCRPVLLILLMIHVWSGAAQEGAVRLSLDDALERFAACNLSLIAERYNMDMAEAQVVQAKLFENPVISLEQNIYNRNNGKYFDLGKEGEAVVEIEQMIYVAGQRNKRVRLEKINKEMAAYQFEEVLRTLRGELKVKFVDLYYTRKSLSVYDREIGYLETVLDVYKEQNAKGNISLLEKSRIQALLLSLKRERSGISTEAVALEGDLRLLLGLKRGEVLEPLFNESVLDSIRLDKLPFAELSACIAERPDLKRAEAGIRASEADVRLQRSLAFPEVSLRGAYDRAGNFCNNYFAIGLSVSVPVFNRNQGNIKSARLSVLRNNSLAELARRQADNELFACYTKLEKALELYRSSDYELERDFNRIIEGVNAGFQKRNISLLEFIDYYEAYKETCLQLYDVKKGVVMAVAREMKPQYGLPTRRTFERYMDTTAQEYAELRYPTLLSARDERHVQTVLAYRNEVREWSIERLMEAEKNFFAKCGRLPEPYEYTAENGLPMYSVFCRLAKEAFEEIIRAQFLETQELSGPVLTM